MNKSIAAIDIGTNSFHLIVARINDKEKIEIFERSRKVLRLNFTNQPDYISKESIEKAIIILNEFKELAYLHNAEIKAVATSAIREAKNKTEFLAEVFDKTKIKINVISGKEEARLIYLGIQNALELKNENFLCIDIGGGSTEFTIGKSKEIKFAESIKLGAVRLTNIFFPNYVIDSTNIIKCENYIWQKLKGLSKQIKKYKIDLVVGTSGTINSVAIINEAIKGNLISKMELNGYSFEGKELEEIKNKILSAKKVEERKMIKGMEEKRADVIPAGVILLSAIFRILDLENITISNYALREGMIINS